MAPGEVGDMARGGVDCGECMGMGVFGGIFAQDGAGTKASCDASFQLEAAHLCAKRLALLCCSGA